MPMLGVIVQLQQAQAAQQQAQDAQLSAQTVGSDAGSQGGATPNSTSVMNLGPGSLGQLFDWGTGQARQQGLPGTTSQVRLLSWPVVQSLVAKAHPAVRIGALWQLSR